MSLAPETPSSGMTTPEEDNREEGETSAGLRHATSLSSCDSLESLSAQGPCRLQRKLTKYLRGRYLTRESIRMLEKSEDTSHLIAIDRRSHLEVSDPRHRYGKNLRLYYDEWIRRGLCTVKRLHSRSADLEKLSPSLELDDYEAFFRWLDDAEDRPELKECPREVLDGDTVTYCRSSSDRSRYSVVFDGLGRLHRFSRRSGCRLDETSEETLLSTGKSGHIFVVKDGVMYTHVKKVEQPPR